MTPQISLTGENHDLTQTARQRLLTSLPYASKANIRFRGVSGYLGDAQVLCSETSADPRPQGVHATCLSTSSYRRFNENGRRTMNPVYCVIFAAVFGFVYPAAAHHSAAMFDLEAVVTIQGTVTAFEWTNPHVYINVEVTDGIGQTTEWEIEGDPTPLMARNGWTATTVAPGDVVTARVNPARGTERTHARLVSLVTSDGAVLTPRSRGNESTVRATGIAGVWDGIRGFASRSLAMPTPTAAGATWQAVYTNADNPVSQCHPHVSPQVIAIPYRYEIEIQEDRIVIRSEFFNVERTVFMDGRSHPENGNRTPQGHSIGWWEGEVLVVDTVNFTNHRTGNLFGIPSGAQKHVVERYELNEDGTQLFVEYTIEDPEYLVGEVSGSIFWDYAPDSEMSPFGCDPENARRYVIE